MSFWIRHQKHRQKKQKLKKWVYIKQKSFFVAKESEKAIYDIGENTYKSDLTRADTKIHKELS